MNNYEKWCEAIRLYANGFGIKAPDNLQCTMKDASYDSDNDFYVYDTDDKLTVINLDVFAKDIYYKIYGNTEENNIINSADAFLVNKDNRWFLIEFKNTCISPAKDGIKHGIIKKAYSSCGALTDILYDLKNNNIFELDFEYESPIDFFRNNVEYILVCSKDKNSNIQKNLIDSYKTNKTYCYTPPFMNRLKGYVFKNVLAYTDDYFMREFISSFSYE